MNVDGNVTSVSVSDNLSSEDPSKAIEEDQLRSLMTLDKEFARGQEDLNRKLQTCRRILKPP